MSSDSLKTNYFVFPVFSFLWMFALRKLVPWLTIGLTYTWPGWLRRSDLDLTHSLPLLAVDLAGAYFLGLHLTRSFSHLFCADGRVGRPGLRLLYRGLSGGQWPLNYVGSPPPPQSFCLALERLNHEESASLFTHHGPNTFSLRPLHRTQAFLGSWFWYPQYALPS